MADQDSFRVAEDDSLRITDAEVASQREAAQRVQDRLRKQGVLRDLDAPEDLLKQVESRSNGYAEHAVAARNVRHGFGDGSIRVPDDESLAAIRDQDPDTAHLFELGRVEPGSAEFAAKYYPPAEDTIEMIGRRGAEGFGVVKRFKGTGEGAGIEEIT